MRTPGRPPSPTIHPRTKPEAEEYAVKNRQTNDWFRHDGKNVVLDPKPLPKTGFNRLAAEIAVKGRGTASDWFQHTHDPVPEKVPVRCPTQSARGNHDKIYGKDEPWYKHEENRMYHDPIAKPRLTEVVAFDIKEKNGTDQAMLWYKGSATEPEKVKKRTGPLPYASENKEKLHPSTKSTWIEHKSEVTEDPNRPVPRVKTSDADEYLHRNRDGFAAEWFGHNTSSNEESYPCGPRVNSQEGLQIANRQGKLSDNWFSHDDCQDYSPPDAHIRCATASARGILQSSQGHTMKQLFNYEDNRNYSSPRKPIKAKYAAEEFAHKSIQGLVNKVLNHEENVGYESNRPAARIKPEAEEIAKRNKGNMGDCFQGYPPPPLSKPRARAPPPDNEDSENKLNLSRLIVEYGKLPLSDRKQARVKPEAGDFAERNRGTIHQTLTDYGKHAPDAQPAMRVKSNDAHEYAMRNRGTVGSVMQA